MKNLLAVITVLLSSQSFASKECRILIEADTLINPGDYSYTRKQPEKLIRLMQEKGYLVKANVSGSRMGFFSKIKANVAVNDFEGEPNMVLKTSLLTEVLEERSGKVLGGAELTVVSTTGEVLANSISKVSRSYTDIDFIDAITASPNYIKAAMNKIPNCDQLQR